MKIEFLGRGDFGGGWADKRASIDRSHCRLRSEKTHLEYVYAEGAPPKVTYRA